MKLSTTRRIAMTGLTVVALCTSMSGAVGATATTTKTTSKTTSKPSLPGGESARFCFQLNSSQQAIAKLTATDTTRLSKIADQWDLIGKVSPTSIKTEVTAVAAAYRKASKEPKASSDATLKTIASSAKKISTYSSTNCKAPTGAGPAPGGAPSGAAATKMQACLKEKGVSLPGGGGQPPAGGAAGAGGQPPAGGGAGAPQLDAKSLAALQACAKAAGINFGQ